MALGGRVSFWSTSGVLYKLFNAYNDGSWKRRFTGPVFAQITTDDDYYWLSADSGAANSTISWRQLLYLKRDGGIRMPSLRTSTPSDAVEIWVNNGVVVRGDPSSISIGATARQNVSLHSDISSNWEDGDATSWGEMRYRRTNNGKIEIQGSLTRISGAGWVSNHRLFQVSSGFTPSKERTGHCFLFDPGGTDQGYRSAIFTLDIAGYLRIKSSWTAAESLIIDASFTL